jgi:hypothetical protein
MFLAREAVFRSGYSSGFFVLVVVVLAIMLSCTIRRVGLPTLLKVQYNIIARTTTTNTKNPEEYPERKTASLAKNIRTQIHKLRRIKP